jgi:hypothetical protein
MGRASWPGSTRPPTRFGGSNACTLAADLAEARIVKSVASVGLYGMKWFLGMTAWMAGTSPAMT